MKNTTQKPLNINISFSLNQKSIVKQNAGNRNNSNGITANIFTNGLNNQNQNKKQGKKKGIINNKEKEKEKTFKRRGKSNIVQDVNSLNLKQEQISSYQKNNHNKQPSKKLNLNKKNDNISLIPQYPYTDRQPISRKKQKFLQDQQQEEDNDELYGDNQGQIGDIEGDDQLTQQQRSKQKSQSKSKSKSRERQKIYKTNSKAISKSIEKKQYSKTTNININNKGTTQKGKNKNNNNSSSHNKSNKSSKDSFKQSDAVISVSDRYISKQIGQRQKSSKMNNNNNINKKKKKPLNNPINSNLHPNHHQQHSMDIQKQPYQKDQYYYLNPNTINMNFNLKNHNFSHQSPHYHHIRRYSNSQNLISKKKQKSKSQQNNYNQKGISGIGIFSTKSKQNSNSNNNNNKVIYSNSYIKSVLQNPMIMTQRKLKNNSIKTFINQLVKKQINNNMMMNGVNHGVNQEFPQYQPIASSFIYNNNGTGNICNSNQNTKRKKVKNNRSNSYNHSHSYSHGNTVNVIMSRQRQRQKDRQGILKIDQKQTQKILYKHPYKKYPYQSIQSVDFDIDAFQEFVDRLSSLKSIQNSVLKTDMNQQQQQSFNETTQKNKKDSTNTNNNNNDKKLKYCRINKNQKNEYLKDKKRYQNQNEYQHQNENENQQPITNKYVQTQQSTLFIKQIKQFQKLRQNTNQNKNKNGKSQSRKSQDILFSQNGSDLLINQNNSNNSNNKISLNNKFTIDIIKAYVLMLNQQDNNDYNFDGDLMLHQPKEKTQIVHSDLSGQIQFGNQDQININDLNQQINQDSENDQINMNEKKGERKFPEIDGESPIPTRQQIKIQNKKKKDINFSKKREQKIQSKQRERQSQNYDIIVSKNSKMSNQNQNNKQYKPNELLGQIGLFSKTDSKLLNSNKQSINGESIGKLSQEQSLNDNQNKFQLQKWKNMMTYMMQNINSQTDKKQIIQVLYNFLGDSRKHINQILQRSSSKNKMEDKNKQSSKQQIISSDTKPINNYEYQYKQKKKNNFCEQQDLLYLRIGQSQLQMQDGQQNEDSDDLIQNVSQVQRKNQDIYNFNSSIRNQYKDQDKDKQFINQFGQQIQPNLNRNYNHKQQKKQQEEEAISSQYYQQDQQDLSSIKSLENELISSTQSSNLINLTIIDKILKDRYNSLMQRKTKDIIEIEQKYQNQKISKQQMIIQKKKIQKWIRNQTKHILKAKKNIWKGYNQVKGIIGKNQINNDFQNLKNKKSKKDNKGQDGFVQPMMIIKRNKMMKCLSDKYIGSKKKKLHTNIIRKNNNDKKDSQQVSISSQEISSESFQNQKDKIQYQKLLKKQIKQQRKKASQQLKKKHILKIHQKQTQKQDIKQKQENHPHDNHHQDQSQQSSSQQQQHNDENNSQQQNDFDQKNYDQEMDKIKQRLLKMKQTHLSQQQNQNSNKSVSEEEAYQDDDQQFLNLNNKEIGNMSPTISYQEVDREFPHKDILKGENIGVEISKKQSSSQQELKENEEDDISKKKNNKQIDHFSHIPPKISSQDYNQNEDYQDSNLNNDSQLNQEQLLKLNNQRKLKYLCQEDKQDIFEFIFLDLCIELYQQPCLDNKIMKSINGHIAKAKKQAKKNKGVRTNLNIVKEYLKRFQAFINRAHRDCLENLNTPMGPTAYQMLKYMRQNDDLDPMDDQVTVAVVVPVQLFDKFEKSLLSAIQFQTYFDDEERQMQRIQFLKNVLHIHNKALFDALNQSLDHQRPFGLWGVPFPWKKRAVIQKKFQALQVQTKFKKCCDNVAQYCAYVCGLLTDKQQSLVGNAHLSQQYLMSIRQDRLSRMLANDLIQNQQRWLFFDDQQAQVLVQIGRYVLSGLFNECCKDIIDIISKKQKDSMGSYIENYQQSVSIQQQ